VKRRKDKKAKTNMEKKMNLRRIKRTVRMNDDKEEKEEEDNGEEKLERKKAWGTDEE
jgi:hypothetical protein